MRTAYVVDLSELMHRVKPVPSWGYLVAGEARAVCGDRICDIRAGEAFWLPAYSFISQGSGSAVVWRTSQALEDAVGPANATGEVDAQFCVDDYVRTWAEGSRHATETLDALLDVPYGSGSWERMDIFPVQRVLQDVLDGCVSRQAAEEVYGVQIDEGGELIGLTASRQDWEPKGSI